MNYRSVLYFNKKSNVQLEYDDTEVKLNYATNTDNETGVVTDLLQGGSSDFSTAKLTVNGKLGSSASIPTLLIDPNEGLEGACSSINGLSSPFTVILYKGKAYVDLPDGITSGGIAWNDDLGMYVITGDCSLTIMS